jgi:hypothetical protein
MQETRQVKPDSKSNCKFRVNFALNKNGYVFYEHMDLSYDELNAYIKFLERTKKCQD